MTRTVSIWLGSLSLFTLPVTSVFGAAGTFDAARIEQMTGLARIPTKSNQVLRFGKARSDITVTVDQWSLPPAVGLVSCAEFAFYKGRQWTVMGELAVF